MDVFKILSSAGSQVSTNMSLFNQRIAQTPGSAVSTTSKSRGQDSNEPKLLGYQLRNSTLTGAIVCSPSGPFQEYIFRVEDAILLHLLSLQQESSSKNIDRILLLFQTKVDGHQDILYAKTPVAVIRVLLRRLAQMKPVDISDTLLDIIDSSFIKSQKLSVLNAHSESLKSAFSDDSDVSFMPFDDEPYVNVLHLVKYMWKNVKLKASIFGFRVSKCGNQQLQEGYYLPLVDYEDPTYENSLGYTITRSKSSISGSYALCGHDPSISDDLSTVEDNSNATGVYIWYIMNSKLKHVYYYCATSEPWGVPPTFGWSCSRLGKSPSPEVNFVDVSNLPPDKNNAKSNATTNIFPINDTAFRTVEIKEEILEISSSHDYLRTKSSLRSKTKSDIRATERIISLSEDRDFAENKMEIAPSKKGTDDSNDLNNLREVSRGSGSDIFSYLDEIYRCTETQLIEFQLVDEIKEKCVALQQWSDTQAITSQNRMKWLDSADLTQLVNGYEYEEENTTSDQKLSEDDDASMDQFKSRWDLTAILGKLSISPPLKNQTQDYFKFIANIAEGFTPTEPSNGHIAVNREYGVFNQRLVESDGKQVTLEGENDKVANVETFSMTQFASDIFHSSAPERALRTSSIHVDMLGVELWPPPKDADALGLVEQLNYVVEISLPEVQAFPVNIGQEVEMEIQTNDDQLDGQDNINLDTVVVDQSLKDSPKKSDFAPIREELIRRLHAKSAISRRRVFVFRQDLSGICSLHMELEHALIGSDIILPPLPDPFVLSCVQEEILAAFRAENTPIVLANKKARFGQPFLYSSSLRTRSSSGRKIDSFNLPYTDKVEYCMTQLQKYLTDVFALCDFLFDSDESKSSTESSHQNIFGKLIGHFLQCPDIKDMEEFRRLFKMVPSKQNDGEMSDKDASNIVYEISSFYQLNHIQGVKVIRPVWQSFTDSGACLRLLFHDSPGNLYSKKTEEELMRLQKSRCAGCGEPLTSSLFRLDKNYDICKFTGSLMCKRWCHFGEKRILPYRLLLEWDHRPHRVSRIAADFLDEISSSAIINIDVINPLLFDGVPSLHQVRIFRKSIATLLDRAMSKPETSALASGIINALLGSNRLHLCICSTFYSIQDLAQVANGELIQQLYNVYDSLRAIVPKKRQNTKSSYDEWSK